MARKRVGTLSAAIIAIALGACGPLPGEQDNSPPREYATSRLHVFDLYGERKRLPIYVISSVAASADGSPTVNYPSPTDSNLTSIYAGENPVRLKDGVADQKCRTVCIGLTPEDWEWEADSIYIDLAYQGKIVGIPARLFARGGDGGRSDVFILQFGDIYDPRFSMTVPAEIELFYTDGPEGNGLDRITPALVTTFRPGDGSTAPSSDMWGVIVSNGTPYVEPGLTGVVTYTGELVGLYQPSIGTFERIDGSAMISLDYGSSSFSGRISGLEGARITIPDIVLEPSAESYRDSRFQIGDARTDMDGYTGPVSNMDGAYNAAAYGGGSAEYGGVEIGGTLAIANETESFVGAFTAEN